MTIEEVIASVFCLEPSAQDPVHTARFDKQVAVMTAFIREVRELPQAEYDALFPKKKPMTPCRQNLSFTSRRTVLH